MFQWFKDLFGGSRYKGHPEAVIVSCYFNPENSPYRLKAFNRYYETIKHLNHRIIECVIGDKGVPQLPKVESIQVIRTENLLWHKESLLNKIIAELPPHFKYVFWVDADVLFTNRNWIPESVEQLQGEARILQPFEYCVHLNKDEEKPSFDYEKEKVNANKFNRHKQLWRSFSANYMTTDFADCADYNKHGHVGFAWAARREVLEKCPLYDRCLIGGADHIIAHAAAGHIPHDCITKAFADNIDEVNKWSQNFFKIVAGKFGCISGDLFHLWHGDTDRRQYLKRIKDFTPENKEIRHKDENGLYVTGKEDSPYIKEYFRNREVQPTGKHVPPVAKPAKTVYRGTSGGSYHHHHHTSDVIILGQHGHNQQPPPKSKKQPETGLVNEAPPSYTRPVSSDDETFS